MARIYNNAKTNTKVMTGSIKSVAADRMSFVLQTQEYNKAEKANKDVEVIVRSTTPLEEEVVVGKNTTCVGYVIPDPDNATGMTVQSMYISTKSESFDYRTLSVVNGRVAFAKYVDEKNEDGTPKMSKPFTDKDGVVHEPHAKAPHFDLGITTYEADETGGTRRVLHVMSVYAYKGDTSLIDRLKKLFAKFDKEKSPFDVEENICYATVVTQPGRESSSIREYNGKEYTNFYCNHMGISSIDVVFTNEKTKDKDGEAKEQSGQETPSAPAAPAAPATGLDAPLVMENDEEEMFIP